MIPPLLMPELSWRKYTLYTQRGDRFGIYLLAVLMRIGQKRRYLDGLSVHVDGLTSADVAGRSPAATALSKIYLNCSSPHVSSM